MAIEVKTGARLKSAVCSTEIIVVRATVGDLDLRCGGEPMLAAAAEAPADKAGPAAGYDEPTLLGKRYADEDDSIEVLCAVAGPSTLSVGDAPLSVKGPRPLPASD